jgi:hypothetical protein
VFVIHFDTALAYSAFNVEGFLTFIAHAAGWGTSLDESMAVDGLVPKALKVVASLFE